MTAPWLRIGAVAADLGVATHVIRYWCACFGIDRRSRSGFRYFLPEDVVRLRRVKALLKDEGFTIAGARKRLAKFAQFERQARFEAAGVVR